MEHSGDVDVAREFSYGSGGRPRAWIMKSSFGAAMMVAAGAAFVACARPSTQFDRYMAQQQWNDAAREFTADSSLHTNESALFQAGALFGTPGRPTYDPSRARQLFATLLARFPNSAHRDDARARMVLLDETVRVQQDAAQRQRELEARIAALTRETRDLQAKADSLTASSDSLHGVVSRMDADRRDREAQLQALRRELQRLKEIDLRPRPVTKP
jgi:hypothetical protein